MAPFSYWEQSSFLAPCGTAIIGAGIVGLAAALRRRELYPNERIVVFDRAPFGEGGSTRNAGFACFGSPTEVLADLKVMPRSAVIDLIQKRFLGLQHLRKLIGDANLGYRATGSYELFTPKEESLAQNAFNELEKLNALLMEITGQTTYHSVNIDTLHSTHSFSGFSAAIHNPLEGSIDTGKMIFSLRQMAVEAGIEIYNGIEVQGVSPCTGGCDLAFNQHRMFCTQVLVCTNGFAKQLLPQLDVTPARNRVLLTKPIPDLKWEGTFHMLEGYVYFRNVGQRILIGGGRHLDPNWSSVHEAMPPELDRYLTDILSTHLLSDRKVEIEHRWTGYLGVGGSKTPYVQRLAPGLYCAVRMGGMGVAIGTLVGKEIADCIDA